MTQNYVQYDLIDGTYRGSVFCSPVQAQEQLNEGVGMIAVSANPLTTSTVDGVPTITMNWDVIRNSVATNIDAQAEAFCQSYVTPGETQMIRYSRKEAEARAWLTDNNSLTPMLTMEAAATGVSVSTLADTVIQLADQWTAVMASVESKRIGAKQQLAGLTNIAEMAAVANINWSE